MPSLYNCKHSGDQYRISKFDSDFNLETSYLCDLTACECPAGHRPSCRHRDMLPKFIARDHIGDNWFFDHDRGGWVQGWKEEPEVASEALPIPSEAEPSTSNQELWLEQNEASMRAEIADSLAPAGLDQPSEPYPLPPDFVPTFIPPSLYDSMVIEGISDMRFYKKQELIPVPSPSPTIRRRV